MLGTLGGEMAGLLLAGLGNGRPVKIRRHLLHRYIPSPPVGVQAVRGVRSYFCLPTQQYRVPLNL